MEATTSAPPAGSTAETVRRPPFPPLTHALTAAWVAAMFLLAGTRPALYERLLQEDHAIEWWTVTLFGAAGFFALRMAWRKRRVFDSLVGAFCLFVAGEEFSWGQRLLGLSPPDAFLEMNRQQELTFHNFTAVFGEPRWVLMMALVGFGVALPALALTRPGRRLLGRLGATAPALPAAAWIVATTALLWWYPLELTGEWTEALAGGLFLVTYAPGSLLAGFSAASGAALALALSFASARGHPASPAELACAQQEVDAIAADLAHGAAATGRLAGSVSVHKRVFTAGQEEYLQADGLDAFRNATCREDATAPDRRRHAVDPWGSAYWIDLDRSDDRIRLIVYSFGPNRRRDGEPGSGAGDDVAARIDITL